MRTLLVLALLTSAAHAQPKKPAPAAATGSVKGTVIFEGEPPERATLRRDTDPFCAKSKRDAEDVIVTKGKLKDVLVRIKNGTMGKHPAPTTPALLDQKDCMYTPRVLGIVAGQKLAVRNSDGTFHNVHGLVSGKNLWNKPHAPKDPDHTLDSTPNAGDVIDVTCDVHAWMHSYAVVQDHPFFAVTPEAGTFAITGLPPGTYTLEAWHPTLGAKSMEVKIGKGGRANVTARFSYKL
jgi:plastocyanin